MADYDSVNVTSDEGSEPKATALTYFYDYYLAHPGTTNYVQRVYSSGLSAWCYYTKTSIDPTPLSTDTTPNWTGSITAFQVLAVI